MAESRSKDQGPAATLDRRVALRWIGAAAAAPLMGAPLLGLPGYHPQVPAVEDDRRWRPRFLTESELATVEEVAELILPATETPGARGALVHQYVDFALSRDVDAQETIRNGLAWLAARSRTLGGSSFVELAASRQTELLEGIADESSGEAAEGKAFFKAMKRLTIRGYYRSSIGMHDELGYAGNRHLRVFEGCTHPEHQSFLQVDVDDADDADGGGRGR